MEYNQNNQYRHELKYIISGADQALILNRIRHLMQYDSHANGSGGYSVRSLYFDDPFNRCFYENEMGVDPREKFRIRIYNHQTERISLECKSKLRGMTHKEACLLTVEQTRCLINGIPLPNIESQPPLLRKLTLQMQMRHLRPVVIVEYDRIPFVYKDGNVRVTFDTNISSSKNVGSFLDAYIPKRPVMPLGQQVLEVKYDAFLPDFIRRNLQLHSLSHTAYSKYYICRKYTR